MSVTYLSVLGIRLGVVAAIQGEGSSEQTLDEDSLALQRRGAGGCSKWTNGETFYRRPSEEVLQDGGVGRFELGVTTMGQAIANADKALNSSAARTTCLSPRLDRGLVWSDRSRFQVCQGW